MARADPRSSNELDEQPVYASAVIDVAEPTAASSDMANLTYIGGSECICQPADHSFDLLDNDDSGEISCKKICSGEP
jgi:hypothetical protein